MKQLAFILLFTIACAFQSVAQERICFTIGDRSELSKVTRIVSIDRVEGTTVTAYANKEELQMLESLGYHYQKADLPTPKVLNMATTVAEMANWDCYPTYDTYVAMMQQYAANYPTHCILDTIGYSIDNRLILCAHITSGSVDEMYRPAFFYSSTMHGDEVTGFYLMLRLIDTLLKGYGNNDYITNLVNRTEIYINPLSNPDGTYHYSNNTVQGSQRYNANYVDLNRNYPDPFGSAPMYSQQQENTYMIEYLTNHHFVMSANLHGGSEVLNFPWDSFTSYERRHPNYNWWVEVCSRFIDTVRNYSTSHFLDVNNEGYVAGGDWYTIPNGRQDYVNYYHNCLELTMELSTIKTLSTDRLNNYWNFEGPALISYINEVHNAPNNTQGIQQSAALPTLKVYPNPTNSVVFIEPSEGGYLYDMYGHRVLTVDPGANTIDMNNLKSSVYLYVSGGRTVRIVKQ